MNFLCKRWLPAILLVVLVGIIVYANTFHVPFVLDDEVSIVQNADIRSLDSFFTDFSPPNRYVAYLTFALNHHFGGLDLAGYHAVNLSIHLSCGLLVFALLRLTFRTPYFQGQFPGLSSRVQCPGSKAQGHETLPSAFIFQPSSFIPLFTALLFVAHPVQTQAVTYVVQRITSLATLFYLLSMVLYVLGRLRLESRVPSPESKTTSYESRATRNGFLLCFAGSILAAVLAMKTKEIAFTLPLAILLYEGSFFRGEWKRRLLYLLPHLATLPIVPMTVIGIGGPASEILSDTGKTGLSVGEQLRVESAMAGLDCLDYLFTQFRVIVTYLRLLVLPVNQNLDYDYPVYTTFFTPPVFLSFLLLTALLLLAVYLYGFKFQVLGFKKFESRVTRLESRLIAFGILWFFLALAVESSFVPIVDVIVEHRLYLPGFGAATAFATAFCLVMKRFTGPSNNKLLVLASALLVLGLGFATWQRNYVWGDAVRLWQDVVAKSPNKGRAHNNLGVSLIDAGRLPEAIETLSRAIALEPSHPHAYNNLGKAYILNDQSSAAVPLLKKAIELDLWYSDAYINLAMAFNQSRQFLNTIDLMEQNLGRIGERAEAHYHLGVAFAVLGNREAARRQLEIVSRFGAEELVEDLMRLLR